VFLRLKSRLIFGLIVVLS